MWDVIRRKPSNQLKDNQVRIRLTREQKQKLVFAAQRAGLDVSSWLRTVGLQAADEEQTSKR
jgi:uncharacterized protein (DUF1778 family)